MTSYEIDGVVTAPASEGFGEVIARAYRDRIRPMCLCKTPPIPMYIARVNNEYIIKRMPDSGEQHAPGCDSYETPAGLSGRGEVEGYAITHEEDGLTNIRLAFSLSRNGVAEAPSERMEHTSATAPGSRLTLRGLLHYLWEESRLSHWHPKMQGKRSWGLVRHLLFAAAESKSTKRHPLGEVLFIPEAYVDIKAAEISARRMAKISNIMGPGVTGKKMMVLLGEIDHFTQTRFGRHLCVKHLPDYPFLISDALYKSYEKLFGATQNLQRYTPEGHLMTVATFMLDGNGVPEIQEIAVMLCNEHWIPVENQPEIEVINKLVKEKRRFQKQLRYNLPMDKPIASATLIDTVSPTAIYLDLGNLVSKWASSESIKELIKSSDMESWVFDPRFGWRDFPPPSFRQTNLPPTTETATETAQKSGQAVAKPAA